MISFAVRMPDSPRGNSVLLKLGGPDGLELRVVNGKLALTGAVLSASPAPSTIVANRSWHTVSLTWQGQNVEVTSDASAVITALLKQPLELPGMGRGLEIRDESRHIQPAGITFGPVQGAVIDDLRMGRRSTSRPASGEELTARRF
jgi:hypothetical protein